MQKTYLRFKQILISLCLIFSLSSVFGQHSKNNSIDLEKSKVIIDSLIKRFSTHFFNGDSVAIYNMYAKGATFGSLKGNEILLAWGKQIRNSIKDDTRIIEYKTTSLSTDSEFLVELGTYEMKDSKGNSKYKGKYLVVWKQEDGIWKLYRDMGL